MEQYVMLQSIGRQQKSAKDKDYLLETINRNVNEGIYRSVLGKGLVYVNKEYVRMFGFENAEEVYTYDPTKLYKKAEERDQLGEELIEKGHITNREVELKRKDGTTFWGYLSSIKTVGDDGDNIF